MIRRILYTLVLFSAIFCLFAPYVFHYTFQSSVAILIYTAVGLGLSFIPSSNHERNHAVGFNGMLVNLATILMTLFPAIMVPFTALLETEDSSFFNDITNAALTTTLFFVVAIEAQYHLNKSEGAIKMPLHRLVIIFLIDVFGFVGLKYLCKWIGEYSGDNFFMCILLLEVLVAGPLAIVVLIFFYYIWENEKF